MNKELLEQTAQAIETEYEKFDMDMWFGPDDEGLSPCGTVACIAGMGYAIVVGANTLTRASNCSEHGEANIAKVMRKNFGLTFQQASDLFMLGNWPYEFIGRYGAAGELLDSLEQRRVRAKVAAERIRYMIETGL